MFCVFQVHLPYDGCSHKGFSCKRWIVPPLGNNWILNAYEKYHILKLIPIMKKQLDNKIWNTKPGDLTPIIKCGYSAITQSVPSAHALGPEPQPK